jgi:hypothetical protein
MSNKRVSLSSREAALRLIDYSIVQHIIEIKHPFGLLDKWKKLILSDPRSKKMWGQDQSHGFHQRMITLAIYKDLTGLGYQKILNFVNTGIKV